MNMARMYRRELLQAGRARGAGLIIRWRGRVRRFELPFTFPTQVILAFSLLDLAPRLFL